MTGWTWRSQPARLGRTSATRTRPSIVSAPTCRPASCWASRSAHRRRLSEDAPGPRTTGASAPAAPRRTRPTPARRSGSRDSSDSRGSPPPVRRWLASAASRRPTRPPWRAPARPVSSSSAPCGGLATRPLRRARCAPQLLDALDRGQMLGVGGREDVLPVGLRYEEEKRHVRGVERREEAGAARLTDGTRREPGVQIRVVGGAHRQVLLTYSPESAPIS